MKTVCYQSLCDEARKIRETVFMMEQGFRLEFDDIDKTALHLVMFTDDGKAIATCRFFEDSAQGIYIIGRIAVLKEYRGHGIGSLLIEEAEKLIAGRGGRAIALHAQCRAQCFYARSGYLAYGETEEEEGCPHIWMRKTLPNIT